MNRRHWLWLLAPILLAGAPGGLAQEPPDRVPPDAKRRVLDLRFTVQDLGGKVEDLRLKETATEVRLELAADVLFDFDKADLKPAAQIILKQAASIVRERARGAVRIEGHTDAKGADDYNMRLSQRRAEAVKRWLTEQGGLTNVRFATAGFGETRPVAPNAKPDGSDDPDGRQRNRRVEIVIAK